jgi:hypothetical protein
MTTRTHMCRCCLSCLRVRIMQAYMQNDLLAVPAGPGRSVAYTSGHNTLPKITAAALVKAALTAPATLPRMLLRYGWRGGCLTATLATSNSVHSRVKLPLCRARRCLPAAHHVLHVNVLLPCLCAYMHGNAVQGSFPTPAQVCASPGNEQAV